ncbi:MAG: response regulator transcription factor [Planctomycetes bacterium]|nr:response regulator transcription factor [Planctomycetota bacterium]
MSAHEVLVVEDDPAIRRGLCDALDFAGHVVRHTDDGEQALRLVDERVPDLVLLDVMLPGRDGFSVLSALRTRHPGLPVILVTARGSESDRIAGLEGGADDYVVKPFSAKELLARVGAVLRRSPERPVPGGTLRIGGRTLELAERRVTLAGGEVRPLSEKETALLAHLVRARGRCVTRDELLREVWGLDPKGLQTRTVDMHVVRLREKLHDGGGAGDVIETVRGKGYRLPRGDDEP